MRPDGAEIRVFRAGDENGIIEALGRSIDRPVSLEEWSWSYPQVEVGRPVVVAVAGDRIVAHVGAVASVFQIEGRTVPALAVVDAFAVPPAGGAAEQRRLLAEVFETWMAEFGRRDHVQLVYRIGVGGAGDDASGPVGGTRVGLPPIDVLVRRETVRAPARRLAFRAEAARDWEPRLDDLWRRVRGSYPFAAVRDSEMALNRHAGHPGVRRHRFLVMPRFSRAAVAFAVFETEGSQCRWVDLVWDHDEPGALDLLSHLSQRLAAQVGATRERVVLGGDDHARGRLRARGFRSEGPLGDLSLTVYVVPPGSVPADLDSRLYVTQTDLDPLRRTV